VTISGDSLRRRIHYIRSIAPMRILAISLLCLLTGCGAAPSIEFTQIPEAGAGGAVRMEKIAGRAIGARAGQRIVLFARSGTWWVQPVSSKPFTTIGRDSIWQSNTHLGTEYAALLVDTTYAPPRTTDALPSKGSGVIAVARVEGRPSVIAPPPVPKTIRFGGYEWDVTQEPTDSGGVMHPNRASNVWTNPRGRLHLRIAREAGEWSGAEVSLTRSLGYGLYTFVVDRLPPLEPATVLGLFTWDPLEAGQNHREIDIELSRWGDPASKNTQFVIQPYYIPANVFRFPSAGGRASHSFHWEPGRVSFQSPGAQHVFTSGIPSAGGERVHINLYVYGKARIPQKNGVEVVIEKFEYLP
jgi:hypothetical protein